MSSSSKKSLFEGVSPAILRARSIIKQYSIRLPREIDIEAIAALRGAYVREEGLERCDGRLVKKGRVGIISIKAETPEVGRKRFTIAHELGHFELHDAGTELMICSEKDFEQWTQQSNSTETEANMFAVELLMPETIFKPLCVQPTPSLSLIRDMAEEFRTSLTATALRYISFSPYRCAIVISRQDMIEKVKWTEDFGYYLERRTKLDPDCLATDFFAGKQLPVEMQPVLSSSWINAPKLSSGARLKEQSWGFKNYGFVLTLIWLDPAFEQEEEEGEGNDEEEWGE